MPPPNNKTSTDDDSAALRKGEIIGIPLGISTQDLEHEKRGQRADHEDASPIHEREEQEEDEQAIR